MSWALWTALAVALVGLFVLARVLIGETDAEEAHRAFKARSKARNAAWWAAVHRGDHETAGAIRRRYLMDSAEKPIREVP